MLLTNTGSNARDFCMLERNLLSHLKLALLLSLLSSSILLRARLVPDESEAHSKLSGSTGIAVASMQFGAALAALGAGVWEYYSGYNDLRNMHAFLAGVKPHFVIISLVALVVFATCIIVLVDQ
ncbi:hypothetical protein FB45DRAFT_924935 [Roridomyces roridus]|uniref:DUF202 domain-containing protein n=1 Tax=Roridomyces roridus TaxID=1738132 RepID=A0AAD7FGN8_9AGAR|nr:hypothetical protein FB45DRAFT_924935 [Roridomyces roridus]